MFEASRLLFYYAVTPVHMGAGTAIGAIDSPIQREVHTELPMFAGSGLKGAIRHRCKRTWAAGDTGGRASLVNRLFGPETNASTHAGALSFSDAQLVALPLRALKGAYVYASSPLCLGRLRRLAVLAGLELPWSVPAVAAGQALVADDAVLSGGRLVLEAFEFAAERATSASEIGTWLQARALPEGAAHRFFAEKLGSDLVILNDADFGHFARHAMVVEPHVRIDDDTGTADDGGLFFTENLPPESLMVGLVQASVERHDTRRGADAEERYTDASNVLRALLKGPGDGGAGIAEQVVQIGGDATAGRGLVVVHPVGAGD